MTNNDMMSPRTLSDKNPDANEARHLATGNLGH